MSDISLVYYVDLSTPSGIAGFLYWSAQWVTCPRMLGMSMHLTMIMQTKEFNDVLDFVAKQFDIKLEPRLQA